MAEERENPRPKDIPDADKRRPPKQADLPAEVQVERNIRRYIRKDGVLKKELHWLDPITETDAKGNQITDIEGNPVRKPRYTPKEAERLAVEAIKSSGRKVEKDPITGRPKAVPGWNLDIRIPGFGAIEQNAAKEPRGSVREELNDRMLRDLKKENDELKSKLNELLEASRTTKKATTSKKD